MKSEVKNLLEKGIIEESRSPWRAQAFVVKSSKPRMVVDYSEAVNRYTELDAYPFPDVESLINAAAENSHFSKLDLKSAYHQVPIRQEDKPLTAFEVDGSLYQFTRMPFGVTNAVPAFQRIMDQLIQQAQLQKTYAYLDDVIICGSSKEEHDTNLRRFMDCVATANMTLNPDKTQIGLTSINLLGYLIGDKTKRPNPERLEALLNFPIPDTFAKLQRLLGLFA